MIQYKISVLFYTHLTFSDAQINEIAERLLKLYRVNSIVYPVYFKHINSFIEYFQTSLSKQNITNYLNAYNKPDLQIKYEMPELLSLRESDDIIINADEIIIMLRNDKIEVNESYKTIYKSQLLNNFNFYQFINGVTFDLISFYDFEDEAISYLRNERKSFAKFGSYEDEYLLDIIPLQVKN